MTTPSEPSEPLAPAHAALKRYIEALREGDMLGFSDGLTSEAYVDFLHMMPLMADWGEEQAEITIVPQGELGDEQVYALHLQSGENSLDATMRMRLIYNNWQVTNINIPGVRERD